MLDQLLSEAMRQAERSEPAVRAAAVLHMARVFNTFDRVEAQRVLDLGIALAEGLDDPDREVILGEAVSLAATVSPDRAIRLAPAVHDDLSGSPMRKALFDMLSHGHVAEAIQYVSDPPQVEDYPFDAAIQVMGRATDEATRLRVLRGATGAMRTQMAAGRSWGSFHGPGRFADLFRRWWRLLPVDEATAVVRDIVGWILADHDGFIRASLDDLRFSSTREHQLFEILGPLRHLDPDRADSLVREHAELAAAAARYPYGRESIETAAQERAAARPTPRAASRGTGEQGDAILVGGRVIPIADALRTDFQEAFDLAYRLLAIERDPAHPNDAPQECWPSAHEFRNILYHAGKHEGAAAARHLERIPDPALRLFASIELAAALAGLPQIGGRTISPGPHGFRQSMAMQARARESGPPPAPPFATTTPAPAKKPDLPPSDDVRITPTRRTREEGPSGGSGPDYCVIEGAPLRSVLSMLYDMPETRIDLPSALDRRYDFALVLPQREPRGTLIRWLREGTERHFHITHEILTTTVDVLTAPDGIRAHEVREGDSLFSAGSIGLVEKSEDGVPRIPDGLLLAGILDQHIVFRDDASSPEDAVRQAQTRFLRAAHGSSAGAGINSIGYALTMAQLCEVLEGGLDCPVIDETRLAGTYAVNVHTEARSTREFLPLLCDRLGLVVSSAKREVTMLMVR